MIKYVVLHIICSNILSKYLFTGTPILVNTELIRTYDINSGELKSSLGVLCGDSGKSRAASFKKSERGRCV